VYKQIEQALEKIDSSSKPNQEKIKEEKIRNKLLD